MTETHKIGSLFGANILIETDDKNVVRECLKWMETMDSRHRKFGEEQYKIV